jgi:hypothetical protein
MKPRLLLDLPFALIQQIRLAHALAESDFPITVPASELPKFSVLCERFDLRLDEAAPDDVPLGSFVSISHQEPSTALGGLARPLIFPAAIAERCRALWQAARPHRYSFAGLVTDERRRVLEAWSAARDGAGRTAFSASNGLGRFVRRQLVRWRGYDRLRHVGGVTVWSSVRGRRFPTKAWDDEYYELLARSQCVLCPSGDYLWSYRFFEAALCGAMPIVEEPVPLYEGFRYRRMADGGDAEWSAADAEHNYRLCRARIEVPRDALNAELERLVALSAGPARSAPPPS